MSRTALLDLTLSFFLLAAFGAFVLDRDVGRKRSAERLDEFHGAGTGPSLGFRPWRVVGGILLGCALATKWNALFFIAAFGLLIVFWDVSARRVAGARSPWLGMLRRDALPAFASVVPVALVTYVATWSGWLATSTGYYRDWADDHPPGPLRLLPDWLGNLIPGPIRSLWHYHVEAFSFHSDLTSSTPMSPTQVDGWSSLGPCRSSTRSTAKERWAATSIDARARLLPWGTPSSGGAPIVGLLLMVWLLISRRDWRAGAILTAVAAGWLPWFWYADHNGRTMFYFYAVAFVPYLVIALALMLGTGPRCGGRPGVSSIVGGHRRGCLPTARGPRRGSALSPLGRRCSSV